MSVIYNQMQLHDPLPPKTELTSLLNAPNYLMDINGNCLKKDSSTDSWKKLYIFLENAQTNDSISNGTKELCNMLVEQAQRSLSNFNIRSAVAFENDFMTYAVERHKDKWFSSHVKRVYRVTKSVSEEMYGHPHYLAVIDKPDFITAVLAQLAETKNFRRLRTVLKQMVTFYMDKLGLGRLDPKRSLPINIIKLYGKGQKKKAPNKNNLGHPLVLDFVNYLEAFGQNPGNHKFLINAFLKWLIKEGYINCNTFIEINVKDITKPMIQVFIEHLNKRVANKEMKPESAQNYIKYLRKWFKYLSQQGKIFRNPMDRIQNISDTSDTKLDMLSVDKVRNFFRAIMDHSDNVLRDYSYFATIASTGLRAREALGQNIESINWNLGKMTFKSKGGDEQSMPLSSIALFSLELYMASRIVNSNSEPLWVNSYGTRLEYDSVLRLFQKLKRLAGINAETRAIHFFRYLLLTELALNDTDMERLQQISRHKKRRYLDPYLRERQSSVLESFNLKYHPIGADLYE